jgi:hypothetical protein
MTDTVKTQLSPLASHFKRVAEFYQNEAQLLAVALDTEMSRAAVPASPFVTIPEEPVKDDE